MQIGAPDQPHDQPKSCNCDALGDTSYNSAAAQVADQSTYRLETPPVAVGICEKVQASPSDEPARKCKPGSAAECGDRGTGQQSSRCRRACQCAPLARRRKSDREQYPELGLVSEATHEHACQHRLTLKKEQGRTGQRCSQKPILSGEEIPERIGRSEHQSDRWPPPDDQIDDDDASK